MASVEPFIGESACQLVLDAADEERPVRLYRAASVVHRLAVLPPRDVDREAVGALRRAVEQNGLAALGDHIAGFESEAQKLGWWCGGRCDHRFCEMFKAACGGEKELYGVGLLADVESGT